MNFRRQRRRGSAALPLASLIDIVFLLLIYFLVTADFAGREADLSSALGRQSVRGGSAADLLPQVVRVERAARTAGGPGAIFRIGGREVATRAELTDILRKLPKEGGVFIRVANDVPVAAAAAAVQACKDAGFAKVSYVPAE